MTIKFLWNGIKGADGKLRRCSYSDGVLLNHPAGTLTIYAKDYGIDGHFPADVRAVFTVENDTDMMTDYHETDRIRVEPSHPLYGQVWEAMQAAKARYIAKAARNAA